jgi:hypothetical protein
MAIFANQIMLPEATIISKIFLLRGKKIILDRDLANFYGIETRHALLRLIHFRNETSHASGGRILKNEIGPFRTEGTQG